MILRYYWLGVQKEKRWKAWKVWSGPHLDATLCMDPYGVETFWGVRKSVVSEGDGAILHVLIRDFVVVMRHILSICHSVS